LEYFNVKIGDILCVGEEKHTVSEISRSGIRTKYKEGGVYKSYSFTLPLLNKHATGYKEIITLNGEDITQKVIAEYNDWMGEHDNKI